MVSYVDGTDCVRCSDLNAITKGENRVECFCKRGFYNPLDDDGVGADKRCPINKHVLQEITGRCCFI